MKIKSLYFILFFVLLNAVTINAQTIDDAKLWYQEGKYSKALPILMDEYNLNPENKLINQLLGVSLFEMGKFVESEKYLIYAANNEITDVLIYLGELFALQYKFDEAEECFSKYEKSKRKDKIALEVLEDKRMFADHLKRLTRRTENVQIIDSLVIPKSNLLDAYFLSSTSGNLMPVNEFFKNQTSNSSILYVNEKQNKVLFSQHDSINGSDLYSMEKLLDSFGNQKRLPETINNIADQTFPFVMPDGLTIYYASNGNNSIGGYDLFVTRYNIATDSYLNPNQLNMPFNSPFNDYLLVIDEIKGVGWFASDRYQPEGSVCVYTFIPSEKVVLLESDDEKYLSRRAKIASIRESWLPQTDYSSLIALAKKIDQPNNQNTTEFVFVINDSKTYNRLTDFQSAEARELFIQSITSENELKSTLKQLSVQREQYLNINSRNELLRKSILQLENTADSLYKNVKRLKTAARNAENRYLM